MEIPNERVGPYVRALAAGLDALVPNDDHVPLTDALAHLAALDPTLSGSLLLPAEISVRTGMPAYPWMQRALAEQAVARARTDDDDPSDDDLRRAETLDGDLGRRMRDRRALHRHLRARVLLPTTRLEAALRRMGPRTDLIVRYDRMAPDGRWLRVRAELSLAGAGWRTGPFRPITPGRVEVDPALRHLVTRHFATPLLALRDQLGDAASAEVVRLGRSWVGPFWFPGVRLPEGVPESLGRGLLLQLEHEVVGRDVRQAGHLDPFTPADPDEVPPDGHRVFRERRFAASPGVLPVLAEWLLERGVRAVVVPIAGGKRRAL